MLMHHATHHAHAHNRLLPNPRIMPFPSNRRTTCRRTPALKKPWPKRLWVPTNETEIRIRLSGGNVESEETVATTRGGELWCGAGSQVGLRCPTSSRSVARRRSPPSSPHFRPSAQVAAPPYLPNRVPPLPSLSLLCARRVPPVCPASALPLSMLTSLNCTLPLPL